MKTVIQRVNYCKVIVNDNKVSSIGNGVLLLIGIEKNDTFDIIESHFERILKLGIFKNEKGKIGKSILEERCDIMIISQITLVANLSKGKKPDFSPAAKPDEAKELYLYLVKRFKEKGFNVATGVFGEYMKVALENDGPVTFVL